VTITREEYLRIGNERYQIYPFVQCGCCGEEYNELELSYRDWCDDCEEGDE
jgi:hypothetical protein